MWDRALEKPTFDLAKFLGRSSARSPDRADSAVSDHVRRLVVPAVLGQTEDTESHGLSQKRADQKCVLLVVYCIV